MHLAEQFVSRRILCTLALAVTASAAACGGDDPVEPPPPVPTTITISPATAMLRSVGETVQLTATVQDQDGQTMTGVTVTWASRDNALATVNASGLVTAVGNGVVIVQASVGTVMGTAEVTVEQQPAEVRVSPGADTLVALGDTVRLSAEALDGNGNLVPDAEFTWGSDDESVVTVDAAGLVTAAGNGTASITVTSGAASGTASVVVAQVVSSLAVEPTGLNPAQAGKQGADTIMVTALDAEGSPVAGSSYRWSTDRQSGWVYPPAGTTDEMGRFQTTWVAGWPGEGTLSLTVENEFSRLTEELATLSTVPANPPNGAATIWINNPNHPSTGYSIDMTPLTEPTGTYYAAIQWDGGYTGLQRGGIRYDRQLQFSVWDAPGYGGAELIEKASDVLCRTFGGEGTGVACELNYPWTVGSTYRFEVTEEEMNGGSAMTLYVTDLAAGSRRYVGTIRFARRANMTFFGMFVEDFVQQAEHCLAREVRSAAIRRPRARLGDEWVAVEDMTRGRLSRWLEDPWNPGTPGCANLAARGHAAGLELVIGGETASDPNASPIYTIPRH